MITIEDHYYVTNKNNILQEPRQFVAIYYCSETDHQFTDIISFDKVIDFLNSKRFYLYINRDTYICIRIFYHEHSDEIGKYIDEVLPANKITKPRKESIYDLIDSIKQKNYKKISYVPIGPYICLRCYYELF